MKNRYTIQKGCGWLPLFILLFTGCTSTPGKKINKAHTIEIRQMQFEPAVLTVQKGDTVVWVNHDIVAHDVTEETAKLWTSGPLAAGQSWSKVVTNSTDYYCSIHVVMKGKLLVE